MTSQITQMRALRVTPKQANSARLDEIALPDEREGAILARTVAVGICGTDREIIAGDYGEAAPQEQRLTLGHESLGEVQQAPPGSVFAPGDRIVGIVRRPDPVPCAACAQGEWDMCRNGQFTERGIKGRNGYCSEYFRVEPEFAIKVPRELGVAGVLLEPTSVVAKAWDHIDYLGHRSKSWQPRVALITGAGPVGLLAALLARQRNLETHVYDRVEQGPKPDLVRSLGAHYHCGELSTLRKLQADVIVECTGAAPVVVDVMMHNARDAIVCLAGLSAVGRALPVNVAALNQSMVLQNDLVFGSVNANRHHYDLAVAALQRADRAWLSRLITRRVPLDQWQTALERQPNDIKVIIDFAHSDVSPH
jgi:threonine dehydrogenase-like Zn-dependent dehydrogenase